MTNLHNRAFYRLLTGPVKRAFRPLFNSTSTNSRIIHGCHHRMGTYWFSRNLRDIAYEHGRSFGVYNCSSASFSDFTVMDHGRYEDLPSGPIRVTHMIRDPRDVAVSGYYYHLWTDEAWAHVKEERWGGQTYQELLNGLPKEEGMAVEIRNMKHTIEEMASWKQDARVMTLRFEEVLDEPVKWFQKIFEFYGFSEKAIARGIRVIEKRSLKNVKNSKENKRRPHIRSSKPGEWKSELSKENQALFLDLYGETLESIGY